MSKFSLSSLRSRAIFLVLLAILPLMALTLYSYFNQRDKAIHEVQRDELVTVRNIAIIQETLISNSKQLLMTLARLPQVQQHDRQVCNLLFAKLMEQCPYYNALLAADREGQVFASAPAAKEPVNIADRFFFQKAVETRGFAVGEPVLGRITQKYNINLAYPILDDKGQLQGVLTAGVDLSWLGSLLAKNDLPLSTALVLTNGTGKVLYRYPEPLKYIGRMIPNFLVKALTASDDGVTAGVGLPGDERLFAFARLSPPWQDMRVAIGLPKQLAVMPVNRDLWYHLIWLGLVALFAVVAAWSGGDIFIVRPVKKLRSITERLAAGDLTVRVGPDYTVGELGLLASSFDQMADSLREREKDLRRAKDELEQRVEERTAELRKQADLINLAHDAIFVRDLDSRVVFWNRGAEETYGWKQEEALGQVTHSLLQTQFPITLEDVDQSLMQQGQWDGELIHTRADGATIVVASRQVLQRDEAGSPTAILEINRDITAYRKAEVEIRKQAALIELSYDAIIVWDLDSAVVFWSRGAEETYGFTAEQVLGHVTHDLFRTKFPASLKEAYGEVIRHGRWSGELVHARADGTIIVVASRWSLQRNDRGEPVAILEINRDITERKRAEEELARLNEELEQRVEERTAELERSNRDLEEFAYVSSHDMQEPLRKIANFSEMLAKQYQGQLDEQADRYFGYVTDGAKRMQALINDLLNYSRVGRAEFPLIAASLDDILKGTLNDLHALIKENHAKISHGPLPTLKVNPYQIGQLLQNLITNAIKFHGDQPPRIHLSARQEGKEWVISVRDNGIGFEPQYAEGIFKVFKRLHAKEQYPGTGIGLAICKKIIERHGGRIWAESEPGRGATFHFTIST